jgi:mono/diheme cytochrome c family protein
VWRAFFFEPGEFEPDPAKPVEWNRGAYLVRGFGHCVACHSSRNRFGATDEKLELSGGLLPMRDWYAPSLVSPHEAGVAHWDTQHVVDLLKNGVSPRGSVMGPMAEVVFRSTQYLSGEDLNAIATFLKALPQVPAERTAYTPPVDLARSPGAKIYERECASCHGDVGEGAAGAYPPLAGNRAVTLEIPANLIRVVLSGGYLPATSGNPRPYGMPPFAHALSDAEIAAVLTYVRGAWGNAAQPVSQLEVMRYRLGRE